MREREWKRCNDPRAMLRAVDHPFHLMPECLPRRLAIQQRRVRAFTLAAAGGVLARVNHPVCHAAFELGWGLAEGTARPEEVLAIQQEMERLYHWTLDRDWAVSHSSFELARLLNVLALLFNEPDGAAARTLLERGHPVGGYDPLPLLTPEEESRCCFLLREIFGDRGWVPLEDDPRWQTKWSTSTAVALAQGIYESQDFGAMPILADALQDAGCDNADIHTHCRGPGPHVRGCWVVDLVLGKE